jgi:hypothetical protein
MPFSAKQHSLLQLCNLMVDAAPLANQHSSRPQLARRRRRGFVVPIQNLNADVSMVESAEDWHTGSAMR